jgi:hypothetical protein
MGIPNSFGPNQDMGHDTRRVCTSIASLLCPADDDSLEKDIAGTGVAWASPNDSWVIYMCAVLAVFRARQLSFNCRYLSTAQVPP